MDVSADWKPDSEFFVEVKKGFVLVDDDGGDGEVAMHLLNLTMLSFLNPQ